MKTHRSSFPSIRGTFLVPHLGHRVSDHREGIEQQQWLIEGRAPIRIDIARHPPVALRMEAQDLPVGIGYSVLWVSGEGAVWSVSFDAGDFPAFSEAFVSFESAWLVSDGTGDSKFFASSSPR